MDKEEINLLEAELLRSHRIIEQIYGRMLDEQPTFKDKVQYLNSMAYHLHNLYGAHEQLFEIVARFFENQIRGERYHTDLLRRMELEIKGVRPALLSCTVHESLNELRHFRHFFRHAYVAKLDADRLDRVVQIAIKLRDPFRQDMEHFLEQLK